MTLWNDGPPRQADGEARRVTGAARPVGVTDLLVVAGFLALLFIAFDDFTADAIPAAEAVVPEAPRLEQICSEQELRHMRAGIDACFDEITPGARDPGSGDSRRDPVIKTQASS